MKKLLALLLALLMLASVTACGGEVADTTGGDEGVNTAPELVVMADGATEFIVMRSDVAPQYEIDAAVDFRKNLIAATQVEIKITTDWVKRGEEVPTDTKELLIGTTNRAETADAMSRIKEGQYIIKAYENRVVVYSASQSGMNEAVDVFKTTFLDGFDGTLKIPADFEKIEDVSYVIYDDTNDPGSSNPASLAEKQKASLIFYKGCNAALVFGVAERLDLANPEVETFMTNGKIFIPAAFTAEKLGGNASYDASGKTLTLQVGGRTLVMTVGDKFIKVDGEEKNMDVAIQEKNGVVFAPVEYFAEMLGRQLYKSSDGLAVLTTMENIFSASADKIAITDTIEELRECHYAMADVAPVADKMIVDYGQPAMIDPGAAYPDVKITTYFNATDIAVKLMKDGKEIKSTAIGAQAANLTETYRIGGNAGALGEYRIVVSLKVNGEAYEYVRYFTVVDTKQFGNGNVALAYPGSDGKLVYICDYMGNRIADYSLVGYENGAALPDAAYIASLPKVTLAPIDGDNGLEIQKAINSFKDKPINAEGYRGVVELSPGTYNCTTSFNLNVSGVILRGASENRADVVLVYPKGGKISNSGSGGRTVQNNTATSILGTYLPAGTTTFEVEDASKFKVGDEVVVMKRVTYPWIVYMEMSELFRNGAQQTWIGENDVIYHERQIVAINGNTITLDTGVSDSFDSKYMGYPMATIAKCTYNGYIDHTGMENFTLRYANLSVNNIRNSWLRNVNVDECTSSDGKIGNSLMVSGGAKYVTLKNCLITHSRNTESAAPSDFMLTGSYLLLEGCETPMYDVGNTWGYVFQNKQAGPIVVYNSVGAACPHQRWATGVLMDSCNTPKSASNRAGVQFINRHTMGSGHGWTSAWSIAWNCKSPHFKIEAGNGTTNWGIGCVGTKVNPSYRAGLYFSHGTPITLGSLYAAQLAERIAK